MRMPRLPCWRPRPITAERTGGESPRARSPNPPPTPPSGGAPPAAAGPPGASSRGVAMPDITKKENDPGLAVLVMLMRFQGVAAEPAQIAHRFGRIPIGVSEMLRCAKDFALKARVVKTNWTRLTGTPLPAIGCLRGG